MVSRPELAAPRNKWKLKVGKTQEGGVELCSQKLFRSLR